MKGKTKVTGKMSPVISLNADELFTAKAAIKLAVDAEPRSGQYTEGFKADLLALQARLQAWADKKLAK